MNPRNIRITTRNARFQEWQALLANRRKRQRSGEFIVHGVRPVTLAARHGWPIRALIYDDGRPLSAWAESILAGNQRAQQVAMAGDLLRELGEKADEAPELIAVVAMPPDDYARIPVRPDFLGVALDRPSSPGNIGTVVRSADAFGASGVVVTGHSADPYDPKAVRASTGSLFAVPVVRDGSPAGALAWARARQRAGRAGDDPRHRREGGRGRGGPRPDRAHADRGRERGQRAQRGLAGRLRPDRPDPDHRLGQLAERGQRRDRAAVRGGAAAQNPGVNPQLGPGAGT